MRAFLLTCLAVLFGLPAAAWDLDQVKMRATENIVQVGDGCSGTIVSATNRLVLTAYHCIVQAVKVTKKPITDDDGEVITGPDGTPRTKIEKKLSQVPLHQFFWDDEGEKSEVAFFGDIVARNEQLDVAILRIPAKVGPVAVSIAATTDVVLLPKGEKVAVGAVVWHIGNPAMFYGTVTRGVMSAPRDMSEYGFKNKLLIQYDGGTTGGSSGGAYYDDDGRYIATHVAGMAAQGIPFLAWAVPMSDVWTVADAACLSADLGGENPARCTKAVAKSGPGSLVGDTAK
jgi:S1-C subfamily serine protease